MDKSQVLNRVYASNLPSRAKTVMFYLVNRSNKEFTCFPAIPTIAKETGLSERTVQRALKELCEEGYIEKTPRYRENGGQSSNLYALSVNDEAAEELSEDIKSDNPIYENVNSNDEIHEVKEQEKIVEENGCSPRVKIVDFVFLAENKSHPCCHRASDNRIPP